VCLADYDLAQVEVLPPVIAYRVGKHKAPVHHLVNQVAQFADTGTEVWLTGAKDEGIKTYIGKACEVLGGKPTVNRGRAGAQLARIRCGPHRGPPLPDDDYARLRLAVSEGERQFLSKPGIYGWRKVDEGSRLLAGLLPDAIAGLRPEGSKPLQVLDLGCGYGYLAIRAATAIAPAPRVTATDSNLAAVIACRANFERFGLCGEVVLDDAAAGIDSRFDLVVCNPPFHRGFETSSGQTDKFIGAAATHLRRRGLALFVVNRFIPLPRAAASVGLDSELLVEQAGFRVYALRPQEVA